MERLKRGWNRTPKAIRQSVVFVIGGVVILAGLVMLITPGPGWAALFLGFAIWATEFAFAEKVRDRMIHFLKTQLVERGQRAWKKLVGKFKHSEGRPGSNPADPANSARPKTQHRPASKQRQ